MFDNDTQFKTNFILWNTSSKYLETQFNGRFVSFAPGEKKSFADREDVLNHVHLKLDRYGVVKVKKDATKEETQKSFLEGLKARHKTLRFIVEQFQAANKAREAKMMSPEAPSDNVSEAVIEDEQLMVKIKELEGEKAKLVDQYFKNLEKHEAEVLENANSIDEVVVTASGVSIQKRKQGRPKKVENDIPSPEAA